MTNSAEIINFKERVAEQEQQRHERVTVDTENGYYKVATELGLTLCRTHFTNQEARIYFAVMQKTFGWHKSMDWVCNDQLSELTGIDVSNVSRIKKRLIDRKIIITKGRKIGVNTCVSEWDLNPKTAKRNSLVELKNSLVELDDSSAELNNSLVEPPQKKDTNTIDNILGETSFPEQEVSQDLLSDIPPVEKLIPKKPKTNKIDFTKLANAYHEILDEMPSVLLPLSEKRKNKIKTLSKKYGLTNERWQAYFEYVAENCQWMSEERPDPKTGKTWKKKNLDFLIGEDCYISVKEQRANDHQ